jgi:hypothetical protein
MFKNQRSQILDPSRIKVPENFFTPGNNSPRMPQINPHQVSMQFNINALQTECVNSLMRKKEVYSSHNSREFQSIIQKDFEVRKQKGISTTLKMDMEIINQAF